MTKKLNLSDYCTERWGTPLNTVKWQAPILANWVAKDVLTAAEFMVFVTCNVPGKIYMNKLMIKPFTNVIKDLIRLDLLDEIKTWDGVFHIRKLTGSKTRWSVHSYGLGLDFNASENPIGKVGKMKKEVVKVFTDNGFVWGGVWSPRRDDQHFEYDPRITANVDRLMASINSITRTLLKPKKKITKSK